MANPNVMGRLDGDETDERAPTELVTTISLPFEGAAIGNVTVSVFRSTDTEDRGGIVIKINLKNEASSFQPYAKNIEDGVELHVAGDIEAQSVLAAVRGALCAMS